MAGSLQIKPERNILVTGLALAILATLIFSHLKKGSDLEEISIKVPRSPFSADPYEYDAFIHHVAFTSVFSGLVTQYKAGSHTGLIASSWRVDDSSTRWSFKIRQGLVFSNGESITPKHVERSLLRVAILMKQKQSEAGVFEQMTGYKDLLPGASSMDGLYSDDSNVIFEFEKPFPELLDLISFGLYSVVHPSNYDQDSLNWTGGRTPVTSGAYKIAEWTDHHVLLEINEQYPKYIMHENAVKKYKITWSQNEFIADINFGSSEDRKKFSSLSFFGGLFSNICFARCNSWKVPGSPCNDQKLRKKIRYELLRSLEKSGLNIVRSFFPTTIPEIEEQSELDPGIDSNWTHKAISFAKINPSHLLHDLVNDALAEVSKKTGVIFGRPELSMKEFGREFDSTLDSYKADISIISTGILVDNPEKDIRFMFKSKEGIRLPDTTGEIHKTLTQDPLPLAKINEQLWDQAVIFPLYHFSLGLWFNKNKIDTSLLNRSLPATSLQWIGLVE